MPISDLISRKRLSEDLTRRILLLLETQEAKSKSAMETMAATITSTITLLIDRAIDERFEKFNVRRELTLQEYRDAQENGKTAEANGSKEGTDRGA